MRNIVLAFLILLMTTIAHADELKLISGKVLVGKIVQLTEKFVIFDEGAGAALTYYSDEIDTVNGQPIFKQIKQTVATPKTVGTATEESLPTITPHEALTTTNPTTNVLQSSPGTVISSQIATIKSQINSQLATHHLAAISSFSSSLNNKNIEMPNISGLFSTRGFILIIIVLVYVLFCIPWALLAKKFTIGHPWWAFIPLMNIYLFCKLAGRPGWWFFLCLLPLVNLVALVMIAIDIIVKCNKPKWLVVLFMVPVVNLILPWYLALSDK